MLQREKQTEHVSVKILFNATIMYYDFFVCYKLIFNLLFLQKSTSQESCVDSDNSSFSSFYSSFVKTHNSDESSTMGEKVDNIFLAVLSILSTGMKHFFYYFYYCKYTRIFSHSFDNYYPNEKQDLFENLFKD